MRAIRIIIIAILLFSFQGYAQKDKQQSKQKEKTQKHGMKEEEEEDPFPIPKIEFGLNFGAYFANKYSANYYNGTPGNVNNVKYVISNPTWNREIKQLLGISEYDTFFVDGYPTNMHYNVAFTGGIFLRYNISRNHSIFTEANYTQLKPADVLTLRVPNIYLSFPDLRFETVAGREGRVMINLGYQYAYRMKSRIYLFFQGAASMCYTQMLQSSFIVEGRTFDMVNIYGNQNYVPNTNLQTVYINQNAFGFGGYLGVGAGIPLTEMFGIEPGFYTHFYPSNLEHYTEFRPSFSIYLRILLHFVVNEERY